MHGNQEHYDSLFCIPLGQLLECVINAASVWNLHICIFSELTLRENTPISLTALTHYFHGIAEHDDSCFCSTFRSIVRVF